MDLIPKPDQVLAAAGNVAQRLIRGGTADLRPMRRTLIGGGALREVYRYRPSGTVPEHGDPVLLVSPLAAPALCYDLRRGCSLVEHLVDGGRPTYAVEYGVVSFRNRALGIEHWVDEVVPRAIEDVSEHAGGRPVHLVGWSLGGLFSILAAADRPQLPIASISVLGTPVDVTQVPLVAPARPLIDLTEGQDLVARGFQALDSLTPSVVRWAVRLPTFQRLVTKPLAIAGHLDDQEYLAQLEAVDRFTRLTSAYHGRTFGQVYHRFVKGDPVETGNLEVDGRSIALADITAPVLAFAGATDGIAPVASVNALVPLLTGSREAALEIVPGGHLGLLTGRAARTSTWPVLDEWIDRWTDAAPARPSTPAAAAPVAAPAPAKKAAAKKAVVKKAAAEKGPAKKSAAKKSTVPEKAVATRAAKKSGTKKSATKKAPAKKTSATKAPAKKQPTEKRAGTKSTGKKPGKKAASKSAASRESIGANPTRRYGSAGSRSLRS